MVSLAWANGKGHETLQAGRLVLDGYVNPGYPEREAWVLPSDADVQFRIILNNYCIKIFQQFGGPDACVGTARTHTHTHTCLCVIYKRETRSRPGKSDQKNILFLQPIFSDVIISISFS
jgi:hypothetical protein